MSIDCRQVTNLCPVLTPASTASSIHRPASTILRPYLQLAQLQAPFVSTSNNTQQSTLALHLLTVTSHTHCPLQSTSNVPSIAMASFASSSKTFLLPRIASTSSKRAFSSSLPAFAPYRTSTGQEAVLPVYSPVYPKGPNSTIPAFEYVDC